MVIYQKLEGFLEDGLYRGSLKAEGIVSSLFVIFFGN